MFRLRLSLFILMLQLTTTAGVMAGPVGENRVVRAVMQNSEPKYLVENGQIGGLCGELYLELAKTLRKDGITLEISPSQFPIQRILFMLDTGAADIFCGAGRDSSREAQYAFSTQPVYEVSNVVAAKAGDTFTPKDFSELAESKALVGVLQGTTSAAYLRQQEGVRVDDSFHDLRKSLELVAYNEHLRFFYYHDLGLYYLVAQSGLPLRVVKTRFRSTPQWVMFGPKLSDGLRDATDAGISRLVSEGTAATIAKRYMPD